MWEAVENIIVLLWYPLMGALGALIVECVLLVNNYNLLSQQSHLYQFKIVLAVFTGFVLAYVLQPANITQAFAIGAGWEAVISVMTRQANMVQVNDAKLLRKVETDDLPGPDDNLQKTLKMMQKAGNTDRTPIVDREGRLMGLVTDGMIERKRKNGKLPKIPVRDIMIGSTQVVKVDQNYSVAKAINILEQQTIENKEGHRVLVDGITVIDHDRKVKGILGLNDMKALDIPLLRFGR